MRAIQRFWRDFGVFCPKCNKDIVVRFSPKTKEEGVNIDEPTIRSEESLFVTSFSSSCIEVWHRTEDGEHRFTADYLRVLLKEDPTS